MTRTFRHNSKARERENPDRILIREERTRKAQMRMRESERLDLMEQSLPTTGAEPIAK